MKLRWVIEYEEYEGFDSNGERVVIKTEVGRTLQTRHHIDGWVNVPEEEKE